MTTSYLTVDDIPTRHTPDVIDFLVSLDIKPIMFCWGDRVENYRKEAIYALKKGAILQNHSYSHPFFSELSLEETKREILRNEEILESLYEGAGVKRPFKLFRFPYGDQGGDKKEVLQQFLKDQGFAHIDDRAFNCEWYDEQGQKANRDVLWTLDCAEYNVRPGSGFTFDDVLKKIDGFFGKPESGCTGTGAVQSAKAPEGEASKNIILIHDHEETEECCPGYFKRQINHIIDCGVRFVDPVVLKD